MGANGLVWFQRRRFLSHYTPMTDFEAIETWSVWTTAAQLAGFMKGTVKHCYMQNMKALGLVVSEKRIFMFLPL